MHHDDVAILADVMAMAHPWPGERGGQVGSWHGQRWPCAIIKSRVGLYHDIARWEASTAMPDRMTLASDFLSMGMEAAVIAGERAAVQMGQALGSAGCPWSPHPNGVGRFLMPVPAPVHAWDGEGWAGLNPQSTRAGKPALVLPWAAQISGWSRR